MSAGPPSRQAAQNIRDVMAREGLTAQDLSERMQRPVDWLRRRLRAEVPVSLDDVAEIADVLNVSAAEIVGALMLDDAAHRQREAEAAAETAMLKALDSLGSVWRTPDGPDRRSARGRAAADVRAAVESFRHAVVLAWGRGDERLAASAPLDVFSGLDRDEAPQEDRPTER